MADELQLRDLAPVEPHLMEPGLPWWVWVLISLAVILIAIPVFILFRKEKATASTKKSVDRNKVYQEAKEAIESASGIPPQEAAIRISEALRRYLTMVCKDPSLFETHEEYLARHEALKNFPEATRNKVSELFSELAAMKYDLPREESGDIATDKPMALLNELHSQVPA